MPASRLTRVPDTEDTQIRISLHAYEVFKDNNIQIKQSFNGMGYFYQKNSVYSFNGKVEKTASDLVKEFDGWDYWFFKSDYTAKINLVVYKRLQRVLSSSIHASITCKDRQKMYKRDLDAQEDYKKVENVIETWLEENQKNIVTSIIFDLVVERILDPKSIDNDDTEKEYIYHSNNKFFRPLIVFEKGDHLVCYDQMYV